MEKFEIGDRVRLNAEGYRVAVDESWYDCDEAYVGMAGTVIENDATSLYGPYLVQFDNGPVWFVKPEWIEPVDAPSSHIREITAVEVGHFRFERIVGGDSIKICVDGECRGTMSVSDFRVVAKVLGV